MRREADVITDPVSGTTVNFMEAPFGNNTATRTYIKKLADLKDGTSTHKERLYDGFGEYVSAVAAGDKLYALTRTSGLFVLDAANNFEQISQYDFPGDETIFNASPAISGGRLYVRSNGYLYCIGKKS